MADLKRSPSLFRPHWEAQYKVNNPRTHNNKVEQAAKEWQKVAEMKVSGKLTALKRKEKEILTSIKNIGWLKDEQLISDEIAAMEKEDGVFRFANLAQTSTQYVRQFIETKVSESCSTKVAAPQMAAPQSSPRAMAFRSIDSQEVSERPPTGVPHAEPVEPDEEALAAMMEEAGAISIG